MQFDLGPQQPVGVTTPTDQGGKAQISASRWAFPLCPDGGRKDSKVTRFVEMEWATRVAVDRPPRTVLTDESAEPSTSSKHPRGDHPSRTGSCVPGWSWTNTLNRARMVTCLMTCQARRPPRWAPRHVLAGSSLSAVCRRQTAGECVGSHLTHSSRRETVRAAYRPMGLPRGTGRRQGPPFLNASDRRSNDLAVIQR